MAAVSTPSRTALAVGICAFLALGAGCSEQNGGAKPVAAEPMASGAEHPATNEESHVADVSIATSIAVEAFEERAKAERIVNENQGKPSGSATYERIVTGVVTDPGNATRVYFATSAYDAAAGTDFVGVYGFDVKSLNWWRLYKFAYKKKDATPPALLRVLAHDGQRLYVVEDRVNAHYPAGTPAKDVGRILAFDFAHPEEGLFPLPEVPDDVASIPL